MAGLNDFKCFVKSNPASLNVLCSMHGFIGLSVYRFMGYFLIVIGSDHPNLFLR